MKQYKPTTKSRRQMTGIDYRSILTTQSPQKSLTSGFKRGSGRNSQGRITMRHKLKGFLEILILNITSLIFLISLKASNMIQTAQVL